MPLVSGFQCCKLEVPLREQGQEHIAAYPFCAGDNCHQQIIMVLFGFDGGFVFVCGVGFFPLPPPLFFLHSTRNNYLGQIYEQFWHDWITFGGEFAISF